MTTNLIWITPDAERVMGYIARVSNPANQDNPDVAKLLAYCKRNKHWSVFEHAHACIEINTTRDIARQILRHRSFAFSEFSGRYQEYSKLPNAELRECRMQDTENRQNSLECVSDDVAKAWEIRQQSVLSVAQRNYEWALEQGIAKEQARALLPEGLTPSRLYMTGSIRSWMHYIEVRTDKATQKEHRLIAESVHDLLKAQLPAVFV